MAWRSSSLQLSVQRAKKEIITQKRFDGHVDETRIRREQQKESSGIEINCEQRRRLMYLV